MQLVIATGKKHNGMNFQKTVDDNKRRLRLNLRGVKTIDLDNLRHCYNLRSLVLFNVSVDNNIDLTPLVECKLLRRLVIRKAYSIESSIDFLSSSKKLRRLRIKYTNFKDLNLEPLSNCDNLRVLVLASNNLASISLQPLTNCKRLRRLNLRDNDLEEINLMPLASNRHIRRLNLSRNRLKTIDLTPFAQNPNINFIDRANKLEEVNITPLKDCKNLSQIEIDYTTNIAWDEPYFRVDKVAPGLSIYAQRINQAAVIHTEEEQNELERKESKKEMKMREEHLEQLTITRPTLVHNCLNCNEEITDYNRENHTVCKECGAKIEICPICHRGVFQEEDVVKETHCENLFHRSHLMAWMQAQGTCPICKERINEMDLIAV